MGVQSLGPIKKLQSKRASVTQGALTANTYATVLSVTGTGVFNWASIYSPFAYNVNYRISIDGTVLSTGAQQTTGNYTKKYWASDGEGLSTSLAAAAYTGGIFFKTSLLIEIQASTSANANDITHLIYYAQES